MCAALMASHFLASNRAGLALTRRMSKASTISAMLKTSRSSAMPQPSRPDSSAALPAIALLLVFGETGSLVPLGQPPVALAEHGRQMTESRGTPAADPDLLERVVQHDLARSGWQQVLAAEHMSDLHQRIVHRVDQRVERFAVAAHDDVVGHMGGREAHRPANQVVEGDVCIRHPHPNH